MTLRFTTTRAIGTAIALTISSAAFASAQTTGTSSQDSTRRTTSGTRVTKDAARTTTGTTSGSMGSTTSGSMGTTGSTGTMGGTTSGSMGTTGSTMGGTTGGTMSGTMSSDSSMMSSSTTTSTTSTTTTTTSTGSTGDIPGMGTSGRTFANGLYFGVHGGANFPQNEINSYYETGYGAGAQVGFQPMASPLGLRLNLNWNRLNGRDLLNQTVNGVRYEADLPNADLYSAFADAKLRLPIGNLLSGLYAVGGGGVTYFRNYNNFAATTGGSSQQNVVRTFNSEDATRFALNGGGGLSFGVGPVALFVEGRYVRVFTQGRDTDYVPVTLGLTFH